MSVPPCDCCGSMTGSLQGREALMSVKGYSHLSKNDLKESSDRGCPCCALIWGKVLASNKSWRRPETWTSSVVAGPPSGKLCYLKFRGHVDSHDLKGFCILISADQRQ